MGTGQPFLIIDTPGQYTIYLWFSHKIITHFDSLESIIAKLAQCQKCDTVNCIVKDAYLTHLARCQNINVVKTTKISEKSPKLAFDFETMCDKKLLCLDL